MDQCALHLEVLFAIGRDIKKTEIDLMMAKLTEWYVYTPVEGAMGLGWKWSWLNSSHFFLHRLFRHCPSLPVVVVIAGHHAPPK
jgi:hypothetical protein